MAASLVLPAMNNGSKSTLDSFFGRHEAHAQTHEQTHHELGNNIDLHDAQTLAGPEALGIHGIASQHGPVLEESLDGAKQAVEDQTAITGLAKNKVEKTPDSNMTTSIEMMRPSAGATMAWPISSKAREPEKKRRKLGHEKDVAQVKAHEEHGDEGKKTNTSEWMPTSPTDQPSKEASLGDPVQSMPPKKIMKLNASGTLGSPNPVAIQPTQVVDAGMPKKRGRPKRSRIVTWNYREANAGVGGRIDRILSGEERFQLRVEIAKPAVRALLAAVPAVNPSKGAHPFFSGKAKKPSAQPKPTTAPPASPARKSFASTPGKIRRQIQELKSARSPSKDPFTSRIKPATSQKGDIWPAPGTLHVRGDLEQIPTGPCTHGFQTRKKKTRATGSNDYHQSVLTRYGPTALRGAQEDREVRSDGFMEPPAGLKVPSRLLLTGPQILEEVKPLLSTEHVSHPAIATLVGSITNHLTAYDDGRGEPMDWNHKYAPHGALSVLQCGSEAIRLRDWMQLLTVASVGTSSQGSSKGPAETKPRKKRRRKVDDMDDFIVSSGDESDHLGGLSELEEFGSQGSRAEGLGRSMIRATIEGESRKTANAIVISGPHGCGKTAMVLATAKGLNFQVFEINPGGRRSGRDVLERIGDVLGNHIVSHDRPDKPDTGNTSADEDSTRVAAALQRDIDSGRQGTMNSFFKSKPGATKVPSKVVKKKQSVQPAAVTAKKEPSRHQKQSIILLEEVDVLFEEDRNFWTTVLSLIASSRRPVVMTCTDESTLPVEDLILHGILRLDPPPQDLIADYLLLMAAQEGHLISRESLLTLYQEKRCDMRASIAQLQFWCQMGIGDPRGGLTWIFQRWPPGTGVDQDGNVQRVVSEGTYRTSLGLLPFETPENIPSNAIEQISTEAWVDWSIDPRNEAHFALAEATHSAQTLKSSNRSDRLRALRNVEIHAETLSALDMQCQMDLPSAPDLPSRHAPLGSFLKTVMDPTQPEISAKSRASYTERPKLLQADEAVDYTCLHSQIAVTACSLLRPVLELGPLEQTCIQSHLQRLARQSPSTLTPQPLEAGVFYGALGPLDELTTSSQSLTSGTYTSLISPLGLITTDIAPYVRSVMLHEARRQTDLKKLHEVIHGGDTGKMRKTRAARGALEGKGRGGVRREKWWDCDIELEEVERTGAKSFVEAADRLEAELDREGTRNGEVEE